MTEYEAKAHAEIARLLEELFPHQKVPARSSLKPVKACEEMQPPSLDAQKVLKQCSASVFVEKVLMQSFAMGYDYAFQDFTGKYIKSWFTVEDAVEAAREKGYDISKTQATHYLSDLHRRGYYEYKGGKYRRHFVCFSEIKFH